MTLVCAGRILGTHGVRGDLKCAYTTDNHALLGKRSTYLLVDQRSHETVTVTTTAVRLLESHFLIRFKEFSTPEPLKRFTGWELRFVADAADLPREEDEYYFFELEGLEVRRADGSRAGAVMDVQEVAGQVLLELDTRPPRLIPFSRATVPEVSLDGGYLVTTYPLDNITEPEREPDGPQGEGAE